MTQYNISVADNSDRDQALPAYLAIDIGKPDFQGQKLQALIAWINENFSWCIIIVADTLQRWTWLNTAGTTTAESWIHSREAGSLWLLHNKIFIEDLKIPYRLTRADDWFAHADFSKLRADFEMLYRQNNFFAAAVDTDVSAFLARRSEEERYSQRLQLNRCNYILDELTVLTLLNREQPVAKVDPAAEGTALQAIKNCIVHGAPRGLEAESHIQIEFSVREAA